MSADPKVLKACENLVCVLNMAPCLACSVSQTCARSTLDKHKTNRALLEKLKSAEASGHVYFSATILDMLRKKALDEITQMYASECVGIQEWRESSGAGTAATGGVVR